MKRIKCLLLVVAVMVFAAGCRGKETPVETPAVAETEIMTELEKESEETLSEVGSGTSTGEPVGQDQEITEASDIQVPAMSREAYPRVDGSTATIPLSQALYRAVTGASAEEAEAFVSHSKTTRAYENLIFGSTDLVIAYEPSESVFELMEERQVKLRMEPVGRDALVFLVNSGNPVKTVTSEDLTDIYSGRIRNWKELGGSDRELVAFQRPENSGSQTLMEKLVMKETPMMEAPTSRSIGEMGELIEAVAAYDRSDNALGYSVYYYARNMYQVPGLRFLAVNGVMPSNDTIRKGTYPFVNEFYAVIREDEPEDSSAGRLFSWLTGEEGQRLVEQTGYVPVRAAGDAKTEKGDAEEAVLPEKNYLEEDERLCADGRSLDGLSRLAVFDGRFRQVMAKEDLRPADPWQVCKVTEPLLLETVSADGRAKRGLYCLEEERWFLKPEYNVLWEQEGEEGKRIWWGEKENGLFTISWEEGAETVEIWEQTRDMRLGDCIWHETDPGRYEYEIRDGDGTVIKTVNLSSYGMTYNQMVFQDHILFDGVGEDGFSWQAYFDSFGNVLLDPEEMRQKRMAFLVYASPRWGWVYGNFQQEDGRAGQEKFIYSLREGRFLTQPGDQVLFEPWEAEDQRYVNILREGIPMVLDERGEPVRGKDGSIYTDFLGDDYFGMRKDGEMQIVRGVGGSALYSIPCADGQPVKHLTGSVFSVGDNGWEGSFYKGEELILESGYGYPSDSRYILHGTKGSDDVAMVLNEKGEVLYRSELGEDIQRAFDEFMLIYRGNYWNLIAYDGTILLKGLEDYMRDD